LCDENDREIDLKLGLNNNEGYAETINHAYLGTPYLFYGFLPTAVARQKRNLQGVRVC